MSASGGGASTRVRVAVPAARVISLEPDVYRPDDDRTPPTSEFAITSAD